MERRPRGPIPARLAGLSVLAAAVALGGCGNAGAESAVTPAPAPPGGLVISPQNDSFAVGRNRLTVVIQDASQRPVLGAEATVDVRGSSTTPGTSRPLTYVGADFPGLPIYAGLIDLPRVGAWRLLVRARTAAGTDAGQAFITADPAPAPGAPLAQPGVGDRMPPIRQQIAGPAVAVSTLDSGVPPDPWHDATVASGLAAHRPMLIYVGEPGRCLTTTCGDTVSVLRKVCAALCESLLFEHIEVHLPADSAAFNPAWVPFHLRQEQPWIYLVTGDGVIADRFEGPAPYDQIVAAGRGTLRGQVPAV